MTGESVATKWQKKWAEAKAFETDDSSKNKKFYVLEMYPYPSSMGLHMGHAFNYTIGDIYARFKRMQGFNVLHPMGYDSFGLPAENAALKAGKHPKIFTEAAIKNFTEELKKLGISYDWRRTVETHKPDYYKWDQWIFLQMYKKGLVYKKTSGVNWCPKCNTVLANEQVQNGKCWRHEDTNAEVKQLEQWYLKITEYADELYEGINKLDEWPDLIKKLQKNWINKSHGTEILFEIHKREWKIFTTRPDTLFGVTFLVVAATHPRLNELVTKEQKPAMDEFLKKITSVKEEDLDTMEKEGVFTGSYATHPLTGEKVPVWAGNFVLADYGSGMVMAVPAHDQRDYEFAKKYNIPIKQVIESKDADISKLAYTGAGKLISSEKFTGLDSEKAKEAITKELEKKKLGNKTTNFRLRDWLISRQRYWGTPIPIYYDENNEPHPVDEKDLPIKLPEDVEFKENSGNPMLTSKTHVYKKNGKTYRLETDTMDTFVNSSWYQLRYTDSQNNKEIFDKKKANAWNPVDMYIGGKEHACMHLIYIRFYTKFLRDLGLLKFDEPAKRQFNQGYIYGPDGFKMSKSRGNVILPQDAIDKYGLDGMRLFLMSVASPEKDFSWSDKGAEGASRFLKKVENYEFKPGKSSAKLTSKTHKAIRDVTKNIEDLKYNLAVIRIRELFESFEEEMSREDYEAFLKLIAPFCPHISEELWQKLGYKEFISLAEWPKHNEKLIDEKAEYLDTLISRTKDDIREVLNLTKIENPKEIKLIVSPLWKYEFISLFKASFEKTKDVKEITSNIMATNLKSHGQDVMKMIPAFLKDPSKMPEQLITLNEEFSNLKETAELLGKEFVCRIVVEKADESKEQKARNALPGKPAIVVYS